MSTFVASKLLSSKGEARRMIQQNAVSIVDGEKVGSIDFQDRLIFQGQAIKVGKESFEVGLIMRKSDLKKSLLFIQKNLDAGDELNSSIDQLMKKVDEIISDTKSSTSSVSALPPEFSDFSNPIGLFTDGACRGNPGLGA